ncbi:MAG: hypothetical protein JW917_08220 [Ignavibacteria bacterium]|nr:hypothetical protein [Ignavibacteria bacterium]
MENTDEKKIFWSLVIITAFAGIIAQYLSYSNELIFCPNFGDPVTKLDSSRRYYDSYTPGLWNQLGTVWLPAHSILLIPFTKITYLWQTGLAGSILGFASYMIGSILIYKIIFRITGNKISSIIGWAVFALNPNILYLQTTAMTEPLFYAFIIITLFFLQRLTDDWERMDLIKASFFMMLAAATRYEGWVIMVIFSIIIFYIYYKRKNHPFGHAVAFASIPVAFILFWLWYNWSQYGDALEFQRGEYSLYHLVTIFLNANLVPTKGNIGISVEYFSKAVWINTGWLTIIATIIGIILYAVRNKFDLKKIFPYGLLILYPFSVYSLYAGQNVLMLPDAEPPGFVHSRYGLSLLPAMALFTGFAYYYILDSNFIKNSTVKIKNYFLMLFISVFIIAQLAVYTVNFPSNIASLEELNYGSRHMYYKIKGVSEYLKESYDGGKILYDEVVIRLLPFSDIPYNERIFPNTWEIGEKALQNPAQYVKWIIIDKEMHRNNKLGMHFDKVNDRIGGKKEFTNYFKRVYAKEGLEIYKRK